MGAQVFAEVPIRLHVFVDTVNQHPFSVLCPMDGTGSKPNFMGCLDWKETKTDHLIFYGVCAVVWNCWEHEGKLRRVEKTR